MAFKVLYVEDNPLNTFLIREMLTITDYELLEAVNGKQGFEVALNARPDLIIMDVGLPDVSGIELTRHIKSQTELRNTPVIALTGDASEDVAAACRAAGCERVLHKPVGRFLLLDTIRAYSDLKVTPTDPNALNPPNGVTADNKKKVLIAEDNRDLREIFSHTFNPRSFSVKVAVDGREALSQLEQEIPDILILDVNMPYMTGLEVLTRVRQDPRMKHMKVIVVTGNAMATHAPEAELADLFLVKPVNIVDLMTFAQRLIAKPN